MEQEKHQEEHGPLPRTREAVDWWLKKWGRDAVIEGKEPLTREDVERLIEVNGGTAETLSLSERDLRNEKLIGINLQGAVLIHAHLEGAVLTGANLQRANLDRVNISPATNLERVVWDRADKWWKKYENVLERSGQYEAAAIVYRRLKEWYRGAGMLKIAGDFHYREEAALTKAHWQRIGREWQRLGSEFGGEVKEFKRRLATAWRRLKGGKVPAQFKE